MTDGLGDLMKKYEKLGEQQFIPKLPILVRIDGRCFHKCTRTMDKPFDMAFLGCMQEATKALMKDTSAKVGYTQSDEISLLLYTDDEKSQVWFDGKLQKIISCAASCATYAFNRALLTTNYGPGAIKEVKSPIMFDARAWQLPTKEDVAEYFKWRELDARRNSVNMLASNHFSHKELQGLSTAVRREKLKAKGISWEELPADLRYGAYFQRQKHFRTFTEEEIAKLPEAHAAKKDKNLKIERAEIVLLKDFSVFTKENLVDRLFGNAPTTLTKKEIRLALDE